MSVGVVDTEKRTVELAFSSDVALERWPGIAEKLSHATGACDLSRLNDRACLLFNHNEDEVIGVVESARIDSDGFGRALVRFGKSEEAEEAWNDVQDGILTKVSVGYRILEVKLTEETAELDTYTVTAWQPYEISLVSIPADASVGVGRNLNSNQKFMSEPTAQNTPAQPAPAVAPVEPKISVEAERSAGRKSEQERVRGILAAGKQYKLEEVALRAIEEGKSLDEARGLFLDEMNKRNAQVKEASAPIGLSDKEARSFSFLKLMRALTDPQDRNAQKDAAFELEACSAAADKVSHRALKGTMIPTDVLTAPLAKRGTDTISIAAATGYTGTGDKTVQTSLLGSSFIDLLRNRAVLMQLGTELAGLVGNVDIPRQLSGATGYWIGEDGDATKNDIDFGLASLRPKTVANYSEVTRKMLMQSSLSIEALIRQDLARGLALAIDLAGFYGDGESNAPVGIKETVGINSVEFAGTQPTYAELVQMETEIGLDNADVASMAYVANSAFKGYAKTTLKNSGVSGHIWEPGNTINGYRSEISNQISTGDVFLGNFADLIIGLWGGLEITVDPYTHSTKGRVRVVAMQDVDFVIRRAASFCYGVKPAA